MFFFFPLESLNGLGLSKSRFWKTFGSAEISLLQQRLSRPLCGLHAVVLCRLGVKRWGSCLMSSVCASPDHSP